MDATTPTQSPFLPGTQVQYAWDSTSLSDFKKCPRYYQYVMLDGWSAKDESVHLRFGIEYHAALQDYDLSRAANIPHDEAVHDVLRELLLRTADFDSDHKTKTREGLVRTVVWYLDKHKDGAARTHILSDGKPAVEQSFRFELDWGPRQVIGAPPTTDGVITSTDPSATGQPYLLCGHLDKVVSFNGELYWKDYKTVYSFYNQIWEPHNQMTLYSFAAKVILGSPVKGGIIDMAQVKADSTDFQRAFTSRTEDQIKEWVNDLHYWFALQEQFALSGYFPMNDTACGMYGGCRFRDICSKSPQVRERFLESNFIKLEEKDRWNPLRAR